MPGILDPKTVKYVFSPEQLRALIAADLEVSLQCISVSFDIRNNQLYGIEVTVLK
jgi:hypothetical protein